MIMKKIEVSIITIGDELLIGQTIDTNSSWMAVELNRAGMWIHERVAVGDIREDILQSLEEESRKADVILITGGLGPTNDDITKKVLCEYFNTTLRENTEVLEAVKARFMPRGIPMLESNIQQALVPASCTVLPNRNGTAPGLWFEKEGKIFVSMPGVPHEMEGIMTDEVIPRLRQRFSLPPIMHRTMMTMGLGESQVAERLVSFEKALPAYLSLAYLPGNGLLKLRLTAHENREQDAQAIRRSFQEMKEILSDIMVDDEDNPPEQTLAKLLRRHKLTMATAESCTGGNIAHKITLIPGSSDYFKGSVVSYANAVKQDVLHVPENILKTFGAVSEQTVTVMVKEVAALMKTEVAVAVSGIMGPGGAAEDKPVGTVWMAAIAGEQIRTRKYQLRYNRARNIEITTNYALYLARAAILAHIQGD